MNENEKKKASQKLKGDYHIWVARRKWVKETKEKNAKNNN